MVELGVDYPELGADYYDQATARAILPLEESPWLKLYSYALTFLPVPELTSILDIGCGMGRFAKMLSTCGYNRYTGVDFSSVCISEARKYNPMLSFIKADAFSTGVKDMMKQHTHIVMLEFLEHIKKDIKLLEKIPKGKSVIMSVPNYAAPMMGHVRKFDSIEEVFERYGELFEIAAPMVCSLNKDKRFYLLCGRKR